MAEVYVTLSEAAELEGVQYQTMARRTQRNKKNFVTKTEKSETGGRDVVLVAVSSLSKQARNAFISEMALIDEDGDVVAFSNFLAKGKDETEVTFTIEDNY